MMLRKNHKEPEMREVIIKAGDKEYVFLFRPGETIRGVSGIPVLPQWVFKLLHLV